MEFVLDPTQGSQVQKPCSEQGSLIPEGTTCVGEDMIELASDNEM